MNEELECFLDEGSVDRKRILGIGISFPGIIDLDRQLITYSHILGVKMISFDSVSSFFAYPCCFINDANAVALNNIRMVLDCDIVLGGYVGSYAEPYMSDIWNKVSKWNTFSEDRQFVISSRYKVGAAALGAALEVIESFVRQI